MVVSGGGFWSSWCSGWTHSVWLQTDIFDSSGSFLSIITGDFCSSPPSLLSSLISSQLPASLPAEAREGPAEPTGASSHGPDTLAQARSHRIRHLNVSLWTLRTWVIKLLIRNNELMNKIIDVLTLHHLWLSSCCSLTVLDIDGSGEGSVPCSKALSIMWDVQFAGWH